MSYREYHSIDKSSWYPGVWQTEPDKVQWQDEATKLPCLIVRGPSGALCGYVGVAEGHKAFHQDYDHDYLVNIEVHGGLTFAHFCADMSHNAFDKGKARAEKLRNDPITLTHSLGDYAVFVRKWDAIKSFEEYVASMEATAICHIPEPGSPDHIWWLGFDCAHSGDWAPGSRNSSEYDAVLGEGKMASWGEPITYRALAYVKAEVASLAKQLAAI